MFGKMKDITPAPPATAKRPPMIAGSTAMMMKAAGLDPEQFETVVVAMLKDVSDMSDRVADIEKRLAAIEQNCAAGNADLAEIKAMLATLTGRASNG